MTLEAVFCDLDGTLINTAQANFEAYQFATENVGLQFSYETFLTTWGQDSRDFLRRIYPQLSEQDVVEIRSLKAKQYEEMVEKTELNLDLLSLLLTLRESGKRLGLVTTAKRQSVLPLLAYHNLNSVFEFLVTGDDVMRGKPDPEPYLKALQLAECNADAAITFEDSADGAAAAVLAKVKVIRLGPWGSV